MKVYRWETPVKIIAQTPDKFLVQDAEGNITRLVYPAVPARLKVGDEASLVRVHDFGGAWLK